MKKLYNYFSNNLFKCGLIFVLLVSVSIIVFSNSFAVELPVPSVVYTSSAFDYDANEEGAWKITKYATWISKNKAMITYNLNTIAPENRSSTDYILVVDGSLNERNSNFSSAIKTMLTNMFDNGRNRVALIGFNNTASLITGFSYDDTGLNVALDSFLNESRAAKKEISYYSAFSKIAEFMEGYTPEDAENVKVVFVTDGKPVIDSPKEVSIYQELKNNYSNLSFLAIQYEMGDEVVQEIKNISDEQIVVNANNVWNVLSNIYFGQDYYDSFVLGDYFREPFKILNVKTINGTADILSDHSVEWNLMTSSFGAGGKASMTIYVEASSDYNIGDILPVTDTTFVNYSYYGAEDRLESIDTPTLATAFNVIYDSNTPASCTVTNMPSNTLTGIYDVVKPISQVPKCNGYSFKGWKVVDTDVVQYDKSFVMPAHDVTLKASWSKVAINKSMDGTIYKSATLYDIMADNAVLDTNLDFSSTSSSNKGIYTYSSTANDNYPIYYYHGAVTDNNLLFAGFCWKIVRTTDTGGVKIIYNGLPNSSNQCTNTTGNIGSGVFNSNDSSIASVGYMYGSSVSSKEYTNPKWYEALGLTVYTWDMTKTQTMGTGEYYFTSSSSSLRRYNIEGTWILNDSKRATWSTSYTNYYTCLDGSSSCRDPVYIVGGTSTTAKYVPFYMDASSSPSYTGGKYVIADSHIVWASSYYNLPNTYVCKDNASSCTEAYYVLSYSTGVIRYISLTGGTTASTLATEASNKKIIFGNWEQWDGTQYILRDTVSVSIMDLYSELSKLSKGYNYTCFSEDTKCASVKYLLSGDDSSITYVDLNAYNLLAFKEAVVFKNTNDSNAKKVIETWYRNNMTSYTKYLEDTVFCNDREVSSGAFSGENGVLDNRPVPFAGYTATKPSLTCNNSYDKFTTSNGLKYPVGLITYGEIFLGGKSAEASYLGTSAFWSMTPRKYGPTATMYVYNRDFNNAQATWSTKYSNYFRPVVSIKSGMKIDTGNGSFTNPYVLKLT